MRIHLSTTELSFIGDTSLELEFFRKFFDDYSSMCPIWDDNDPDAKPKAVGFFVRRTDHIGKILNDQMDDIEERAKNIFKEKKLEILTKLFNEIKYATRNV